MKERVTRLLKPMIFVAAAIFAICCLIKKPTGFDDYSSYIGYAISGITILFILYEKILWKYIPWNRPPILKNEYSGTLSYIYNKQPGTKDISIAVKQTWLSVEITTKTDINASYTVTGSIVNERGVDVLYYTYVTDPSALSQNTNSIQFGTCRMVLNADNKNISGKYWTSSQTVGNLVWNEVDENGR